MVADVNVKPQITNASNQNPRSVPLYKKANWENFKTHTSNTSHFASDFMLNYENKSVEKLWISFKSATYQGIVKFIPIKRLRAKRSLPWITREIKHPKTRSAVSCTEKVGEEQGLTPF